MRRTRVSYSFAAIVTLHLTRYRRLKFGSIHHNIKWPKKCCKDSLYSASSSILEMQFKVNICLETNPSFRLALVYEQLYIGSNHHNSKWPKYWCKCSLHSAASRNLVMQFMGNIRLATNPSFQINLICDLDRIIIIERLQIGWDQYF
jgi:hypothetical protein